MNICISTFAHIIGSSSHIRSTLAGAQGTKRWTATEATKEAGAPRSRAPGGCFWVGIPEGKP